MIITLAYPPALDHDDSPARLELDADLVPPRRPPAFASRDQVYHLTITNHARKSSEPYDVANPHALYHLAGSLQSNSGGCHLSRVVHASDDRYAVYFYHVIG